jgi:hypothetical protein
MSREVLGAQKRRLTKPKWETGLPALDSVQPAVITTAARLNWTAQSGIFFLITSFSFFLSESPRFGELGDHLVVLAAQQVIHPVL